VKSLREIMANIEAQISGRLQTYSPESEVRADVVTQRVIDAAEIAKWYEAAMQEWDADYFRQKMREVLRGWLVSTKQEVSE
jgi:hypothetical protein